jgi:hypothetical protein
MIVIGRLNSKTLGKDHPSAGRPRIVMDLTVLEAEGSVEFD